MSGRGKVLALALAQVAILLGWAGHHERLWATAPTFRMPLLPIDPYDLVRGRYFILNPRDGRIEKVIEGTRADGEVAPEDEVDDSEPTLASAPLLDAAAERFLGPRTNFTGDVRVGFCKVPDRPAVERVCAITAISAAARPPQVAHWVEAQASFSRRSLWNAQYQPLPRSAGHRLEGAIDFDLERFFLPDAIRLPAPENASGWEVEVVYRDGLPLLPKRLWFDGKPIAVP